jgi:hypothetical protein
MAIPKPLLFAGFIAAGFACFKGYTQLVKEPQCTTAACQCAKPYTEINDRWRAVSQPAVGKGPWGKPMGDVAKDSDRCADGTPTGVGGGEWYRFMGTRGDVIPINKPDTDMCGTLVRLLHQLAALPVAGRTGSRAGVS